MKKVREFQNFPKKKLLVKGLLEIIFSINCKQFMFRNIPFLIFMAWNFSKHKFLYKIFKLLMDENGY